MLVSMNRSLFLLHRFILVFCFLGTSLTSLLKEKQSEFDAKFENCFKMAAKVMLISGSIYVII